jgi:hypothetical protein
MEISILNKFNELVNEYALTCKLSGLQLSSITKSKSQVENVSKLSHFKSTKVRENEIILDTNSLARDSIGCFPLLVEKSCLKQQGSLHDKYDQFNTSLNSLFALVMEMIELEDSCMKKAKNHSPVSHPFNISIFSISEWLQEQVYGYKLDYLSKKKLVETGNLETLSAEWEKDDYINYKQQAFMEERLRLVRLLGKQ